MTIVIAGGGIGGLTAALSLQAAGHGDVTVLEAARELHEVGVGVNLPPHAVRELTELGLGGELAHLGVPTAELCYFDRSGRLIWNEPRGLAAGYHWPQYSIHRGKLQSLLASAVRQRLGRMAIRTDQRVSVVHDGVDAPLDIQASGADGRTAAYRASLLIAADGIRSTLRDRLIGYAVPLATNGWSMFRGTSRWSSFLSGRTMAIIGDEHQRVVVYPIEPGLINWLLVRLTAAGPANADQLGNWNIPADPGMVAGFVRDWRYDWLDLPALLESAPQAYEYPMADLDPLPQWVFGRSVLLGDAAHAMYPFGSNGASQAILDARVLAYELATGASLEGALAAYENKRRPVATEVQLANRRQAGDVMARVSALARSNAHDRAATELQRVERDYKRLAGFDVESLNQRPSLNVTATS
jgi:2-polyprenyl-6-methoxyphenol hydroxylase-like FAD-dependent oxidoreductase